VEHTDLLGEQRLCRALGVKSDVKGEAGWAEERGREKRGHRGREQIQSKNGAIGGGDVEVFWRGTQREKLYRGKEEGGIGARRKWKQSVSRRGAVVRPQPQETLVGQLTDPLPVCMCVCVCGGGRGCGPLNKHDVRPHLPPGIKIVSRPYL